MRYLFSILLATILLSCKKTEDSNPGNLPELSTKNVAYGTDAAQKMDIYLPADRSSASTKVMILIHGGGWTGGDKSEFDPYISALQKRFPDYAFFSLNYRLYNGVTNQFPAQEIDIKAAVNYIMDKRGEYEVSSKMVLMGISAGAHLALLHAYKHISPVKAKAVISFFGPTDLTEFYNNPPSPSLPNSLKGLLGSTPSDNPSAYQQSSPAYFVSGQSMPTLLLHGSADNIVPVSQSNLLKAKLDSKSVTNQQVIYPSEGHGWFGANLDDSFNKMQAFLDANVKWSNQFFITFSM